MAGLHAPPAPGRAARLRLVAAAAGERARRVPPMGRQALLLACSLAGVILGAALIARWAVGLAVIGDSLFGVWWALMRDVGDDRPRPAALSHEEVLERWRAAS